MKKLELKKNKKGIAVLYGYVMWFILLAILLGIGLLVLEKLATEVNESGGVHQGEKAYTSVNDSIAEISSYSDWFGIIVIVTVAAVVIGLVTTAFIRRGTPTV